MRITNPTHLRLLALALDQTTHRLPPSADALAQGEALLRYIDEAVIEVNWILAQLSGELHLSYHGKTERPPSDSHDRRATAISSCAAPLGTALSRLGKVMDRLSALHPVLGPRVIDADVVGSADLLRPLHRDIAGARTAMRRAAKQFRLNADRLDHPAVGASRQLAPEAR
ncbi:hypothetical protein ACH4TC_01320 [Streptomyces spororaveus]|uniref:hypothetical protein n=1 Tax=Streptomyces spororaveus TaxID=284039 RepID=UPI00379BAF50